MPWYWTDELARSLIEAGKVDQARVSGWIAAPVAVRRDSPDFEGVATALLEEDGEPPSPSLLAA